MEPTTTLQRALSFEPELLNAELDAWKKDHYAALEHAKNVGRMLCEAKDCLLHGQWKAWLAENFDGSYETAVMAMKVYGAWQHQEALLRDVDGQLPQSIRGTLAAIKRSRRQANQPAIDALNQAAEADDSVRRRKLIAAYERAALDSAEALSTLSELVELLEDEAPKRAVLAGIARECAQAWQRAADALAAGEQLQVA